MRVEQLFCMVGSSIIDLTHLVMLNTTVLKWLFDSCLFVVGPFGCSLRHFSVFCPVCCLIVVFGGPICHCDHLFGRNELVTLLFCWFIICAIFHSLLTLHL